MKVELTRNELETLSEFIEKHLHAVRVDSDLNSIKYLRNILEIEEKLRQMAQEIPHEMRL